MNTNLSSTVPSQLETECLVVVVLDPKRKKSPAKKTSPRPRSNAPTPPCAKRPRNVISSGEVTGKSFETTLLHHPAGLKAKRLLLVGGGKAKIFPPRNCASSPAPPCARSRARASAALPSLCPRTASPLSKTLSAPSSKAHSSATSTPTTTRAIARTTTRRSTPSPSSCQAIPSP